MKSAGTFRWIAFAVVSISAMGCCGLGWAVLAYVQMLHAWGFRGMPKPWWLEALSWVVWGTPVLAAVFFPLMLVAGIYMLSRTGRKA